jgi:two-component system, chemotaxis family, protein-glutamate methylesterase/glutaminase
MSKLRVLVVDDSAFNRQTISEILTSHNDIEVVGKASDGEEGLKLAMQLKPDLITLDIEMPRMDGFTFLRLLMSKQPTPVIVISSHSRKDEVFKALELGALDFIAKPSHHLGPDLGKIREELIAKTLTVRALELTSFKRRNEGPVEAPKPVDTHRKPGAAIGNEKRRVERVVVLGASTGGPPALEAIFRSLGPSPGTAFLVAQHMPEKFTRAFAERLNRMAAITIVEAEDLMPLRSGHAFVAPGGCHMEVASSKQGEWVLHLHPRGEEDRFIPSIDRLFQSAAREFKKQSLAVVLTGMGSDGAEGVRTVRNEGGMTLAESPDTAIVYGMPKEAIRTGAVQESLALPQIIERILAFADGRVWPVPNTAAG